MSLSGLRNLVHKNFKVIKTGDFTVKGESLVLVNKTSGAATAVTLPPSVAVKIGVRELIVVDGKGDAGTNNITLTAAGSDTINGSATLVMASNNAIVRLVDNGGGRWVGAEVDQTLTAYLEGVTAGTAAASKAVILDSAGSVTGINSLTATTLTANTSVTTATTTSPIVTANTSVTGGVGTFNSLSYQNPAAVAATGSVIGNAAALSAGLNVVSGADDTKGVILPVANGQTVLVYSSQATNGLKVYPQVNSAINGGTANAAIVLEGKSLAVFQATNATNWGAIFTLNT